MMKKISLFVLLAFPILSVAQTDLNTKCFLSYFKTIYSNTQFEKIDSLTFLKELPMNNAPIKRTIYYYPYQGTYFIGLLMQYFKDFKKYKNVSIDEEKYLFVFDARKEQFYFFFPDLNYRPRDTTTLNTLIQDNGWCWIFNKKYQLIRMATITHTKVYGKDLTLLSAVDYLQLEEYKIIDKTKAKTHIYKTKIPLTYDTLLTSTIESFVRIIDQYGQAITEETDSSEWATINFRPEKLFNNKLKRLIKAGERK